MPMPLPPSRSASTASLAGADAPDRPRRRARFSERREAPFSADGTPANSLRNSHGDAFVRSHFEGVQSRLRPSGRSNKVRRQQRQQLPMPANLQSIYPQSATLEFETEMGDEGDVDVIDCELIASRKELQRWRLSLTDFHAILTGGTEAIEGYRQEQRRKDASAIAAQKRALDVEAALAAEEAQETLQRSRTAQAAPQVSLQTLIADEQLTAAAEQPAAVQASSPEPLWRTILAWPWRALKRLWQALLRAVG